MKHVNRNGEDRWITHREEAQIRLAAWGSLSRTLSMVGQPPENPYSQQSFLSVRVDCDQVYHEIEYSNRVKQALEVDEWLKKIEQHSHRHYIAAAIHYVAFPHKHQFKQRLAEWKTETGLKGQTRYYDCVRAVEADIAIQIKLAEAFD